MRYRTKVLAVWFMLAAFQLVCSTQATAAQHAFTEWTDAEKEVFLRNADILGRQPIGVGVTDSDRALLDDGATRHEAHIQTIDRRASSFRFEDGTTEVDFRDRYTYNIAAYRLDRMIGLNMVPVSIQRRVGGLEAALTWWVDDYQMTDTERVTNNIAIPTDPEWVRQQSDAVIFQELIRNTDANRGNTVITNDWKIRLIDFTRAFRPEHELSNPYQLPHELSRSLYDGLRSLSIERLQDALDGLVEDGRIEAILSRRAEIVRHFDDLIAARGEGAVLLSD